MKTKTIGVLAAVPLLAGCPSMTYDPSGQGAVSLTAYGSLVAASVVGGTIASVIYSEHKALTQFYVGGEGLDEETLKLDHAYCEYEMYSFRNWLKPKRWMTECMARFGYRVATAQERDAYLAEKGRKAR